MEKVSVIGAGGWGCALACVLCDNDHEVTLWSALPEEVEELKKKRENAAKLPGIKLSDKLFVTDDLAAACQGKGILVFAVPSVFVRSTARAAAPFVTDGQMIVNVAKGCLLYTSAHRRSTERHLLKIFVLCRL